MELINSLLSPMNLIFEVLMLCTLVIFYIKYKSFLKLKHASPFLVGLGVLGTFVGIFSALLNFNPNDIQNSISALLEGLKTAFITSIIGMIISLVLNIISGLKEKNDKQSGSNPLETLINLQRESISKQEEVARANNDYLKMIVKSLVGDGESTLLTQIQKLRTNMQDGFDRTEIKMDKMVNAFESFATKMAENNYNALIVALREVIADFNAKINEQFGENFKHLNDGVGKMLVWQENYTMTIEIQTRALEETITGIEKVSSRFETIVSNSERFDEVASSLSILLNELNLQRNELQGKLEEFGDIGESAKNAFDIIDEKVNMLINTISNSIKTQSDKTDSLLKTAGESMKSQNIKFTETQDSFANSLKLVIEKNKELTNDISTKVENSIIEHSKKFSILQDNLNSDVRRVLVENSNVTTEFLKKGSEELTNKFVNFQGLLNSELEKSLKTLGNQLASLSNQFVKDYSPLTNQLRNVLKIAEGLNNGTNRN